MLREGMFIADRYEILEKIGSGGMADVYKAKCHKLNRYVAIKVLKPEFCEDKTFVAKFRAEAQSAAGLVHSNIVSIYDTGEENGIYYIVMELVEGITLKKYIEKKGKLGVREAVSVAIQVAQGIEAAHKHHIVHRDIKPQNIIISKEGKVKVTDFGIARAASSNTINSSVMGSVHYISPEQARGGYSDEKSDIYSFGITLFEMLTGRVPFEGDTTVAVALQHIQEDMVSPRKYLPDIPISVEKIVLKCTQKKTDRRYQNMTDLIADLKRSLVTPNEDFVVISSVVPNGVTQMIDDDELAEISHRAVRKTTNTTPAASQADDIRDRYADDGQDADDDQDIELTEEDDKDTAASKKIDRVITILGIAVGVVILVITIIVIVKMVKLFSTGKNSSSVPKATQEETGDKVEVPKLTGYTYDAAEAELNKLGLGIRKIEDYSDLYEEGKIFEQSVEAGDMVAKNTTIVVSVSKGTSTYEETDDESKINTVASTDPKAGDTVKSGDTVTITLYKGVAQKMAKVPNVKGYTKEDAESELKSLGFNSIEYEYDFDNKVTEGKVISQSGATVGEEAPIDTTVITLVISKGQKATEPEPTKPEETKPEETKPQETAAQKHKIVAHIKYSDLKNSISDAAEGSEISIRFVASYTDASGNVTTKQVSSVKHKNGEFNDTLDIDFETSDIDTSKGATITAHISYKDADGADKTAEVPGLAATVE